MRGEKLCTRGVAYITRIAKLAKVLLSWIRHSYPLWTVGKRGIQVVAAVRAQNGIIIYEEGLFEGHIEDGNVIIVGDVFNPFLR